MGFVRYWRKLGTLNTKKMNKELKKEFCVQLVIFFSKCGEIGNIVTA